MENLTPRNPITKLYMWNPVTNLCKILQGGRYPWRNHLWKEIWWWAVIFFGVAGGQIFPFVIGFHVKQNPITNLPIRNGKIWPKKFNCSPPNLHRWLHRCLWPTPRKINSWYVVLVHRFLQLHCEAQLAIKCSYTNASMLQQCAKQD